MTARAAVIAAGMAAEVVAWRFIARGTGSIWRTLIPIYVVAATLAVVLGPGHLSGRIGVIEAASVGAGSGAALYAGTALFVGVASGWRPFREAVARTYSSAGDRSTAVAVILSAVVAAPAEELFWRGLALGTVRLHASSTIAGLIAWFGYVLVKLSAWSLPILAGAIVGGAVWTFLAVRTGGVLASIASHALWTALMVALPPYRVRASAA